MPAGVRATWKCTLAVADSASPRPRLVEPPERGEGGVVDRQHVVMLAASPPPHLDPGGDRRGNDAVEAVQQQVEALRLDEPDLQERRLVGPGSAAVMAPR